LMPFTAAVSFKPLGLFRSFNLSTLNLKWSANSKETESEKGRIALSAGAEQNVLFEIEMKNPSSLVNLNALSVGQIEIEWASAEPSQPRQGLFLSDIIQRRSLFCRKVSEAENEKEKDKKGSDREQHIEILIVRCPSSVMVHSVFSVTLHIFNLDRVAHSVWLSMSRSASGYLLGVNVTRRFLGVLETSSSLKTEVQMVGLAAGIHALSGIVIETQTQSLSGRVTRRMQYESSQFVYIDIPDDFGRKQQIETETQSAQGKHRGSLELKMEEKSEEEGEAEAVKEEKVEDEEEEEVAMLPLNDADETEVETNEQVSVVTNDAHDLDEPTVEVQTEQEAVVDQVGSV